MPGSTAGRTISSLSLIFCFWVLSDDFTSATEKVQDDSPLASVLLTAARQGMNWSGTPLELFRTVSKIEG
jgi:hypothetical protein